MKILYWLQNNYNRAVYVIDNRISKVRNGRYAPVFIEQACIFGSIAIAARIFPAEAARLKNVIESKLGSAKNVEMAKLAAIGTYGEMLGQRLSTGAWNLRWEDNIAKPLFWAPFGLLLRTGVATAHSATEGIASSLLPILNTPIRGVPMLSIACSSFILNGTFYPVFLRMHHAYNNRVRSFNLSSPLEAPLGFFSDIFTWDFLRPGYISSDWVESGQSWFLFHFLAPFIPSQYQAFYQQLALPGVAADWGRRGW